MLQSIRDRTQGWIAGIIISMVILSFALWGIHSYVAGFAGSDVIAKVNGVDITKRQLTAAYERLRHQAQQTITSGSAVPDNLDSTLRQRALDTLIHIQILKLGAADENYKISPHQVDNFLESMPEFQVNGQFSTTRFQQLLATTMYTPMDFLNLIESTLLIDQPRLGVILTSFALPNEVADSIALINQERDVQYIQIPIDTFLKQNIAVSDQDIQAYYDSHQDQYKSPETVSVDYLELSLQDLMTQMQPSAADLNNYYKENINTYTLPAQWSLQKLLIPIPENASEQQLTDAQNKAKDILEKISSGDDFATLAQQYPAPDSANDKAGTWVTLSQLPIDLQKPVSDLSKPGQNTDPIRTNSGYLIVKATGLKAAQVVPYDQIKDKVKDALVKQLAEEKFADLKDKLSNVSYEHPDTLEPAAKAIGMQIKTSPAFTLDKGLPDQISNYKKVRDAAFSEDVLHSQNNSDVIQISPEKVVVIRAKEHVNAALLSLNNVRQQIVDILQKQKAEEKAQAQAEEMLRTLKSGMAADVVAQKYFLPWVNVGYIGRYSTKIDSAILFTAFRLPKPDSAKNAMYTAVKLPNGYAVVGVNAVRDGSVSGNKDQYEVFDEQLQNSIGSLEYKLYEKSLVADSKISNYSKKAVAERTFA